MTSGSSLANYWTLIALVFIIQSCASGQLNVQSEPEKVDVFISAQDLSKRKVGETPLNYSLNSLMSNGDSYQVSLEKEGFQTESVIIPNSKLSGNLNINLKLKEIQDEVLQCPSHQDNYEQLSRGIANAQRLIESERLQEGQTLVNSLLMKFPNVSVLHDFAGNIDYLKRDFVSALEHYEQSDIISPGNAETRKVMRNLRSRVESR